MSSVTRCPDTDTSTDTTQTQIRRYD